MRQLDRVDGPYGRPWRNKGMIGEGQYYLRETIINGQGVS